MWILDRCAGRAHAHETAIGYMPDPADINTDGLDIAPETMQELLSIDREGWKEEVHGIDAFYQRFDRLPEELKQELKALDARLNHE